MFVTENATVPVDLATAAARLDSLAGGGALLSASQAAYSRGLSGLKLAGAGPDLNKLVRAYYRGPVMRHGAAVLTLRWEARGPDGCVFPALRAEITATRATGGETLLRLAGSYNAPPGAAQAEPDDRLLHWAASVTVREFLGRLTELLTLPVPDARKVSWPSDPDTT